MSSSILVKPLPLPLMAPVQRPPMSSPRVNCIRRNLFGSAQAGEIDELLMAEHKQNYDRFKAQYNIELEYPEDKCNLQISTTAETATKKNLSRVCASPYARPDGIKRAYRVRKACIANSNVPKRKVNENNNNNTCSSKNNNNNNVDADADSHKNE